MQSLFSLYPHLSSCPLALVSWGEGCDRARWRLVDWIGVVCGTPSRLSFGLVSAGSVFEDLRQAGEFAVNVPDDATLARLKESGGLDCRELPELSFTPGASIQAPCLHPCPVIFECRILEMRRDFDRTLVTGEVLSATLGGRLYQRESRLDLCGLRPLDGRWFESEEETRHNQAS